MKELFTIEYGNSKWNFEWDYQDRSIWLIRHDSTKINYGNGSANTLEKAKILAEDMLKSAGY